MNVDVRKKDKLQFPSLVITFLIQQQCWTCRAEVWECNKTEGTFELEGTSDVVSYHDNTCMNGKYIFKQFESGKAQAAIIRFQCSSRAPIVGIVSLAMPKKNLCRPPSGNSFDFGCLAFVRNSTLESCLSQLNISECTVVVLENDTLMEISFFNTDLSTFMFNYTLLQCAGQEENSELNKTQPSNNITNGVRFPRPILCSDGSEEIPGSTLGVKKLILTIVGAGVLALGLLALGLGLAWRSCLLQARQRRRVKRTSPEQHSTRSTNAIIPYYETSVTSAASPIYENSEIISLSQDAYIEPECDAYFDSNYVNTSPVEVSVSGGFYEPVQQAEVRYLTPITRGVVDGESRYQYPVRGQVDDAGYMQVN